MHNVGMRATHHALERRVQFSRGHWRRDEASGAVSTGWWESVTVTLSPAERRPALLHRALASAVDTIVPVLPGLMAGGARHLIERRAGRRAALPRSRRVMAALATARSDQKI
jgi:hypothetical protein